MLLWKRLGLPVALLLCSSLPAAAQHLAADRVMEGSCKSYWVDSTLHPGSTYIWAINDIVFQSGTACLFTHRWSETGNYDLTVRQITAMGCTGAGQTLPVVVLATEPVVSVYPNPIFGPDLNFKILLSSPAEVTIDLFSPYGQLVDRVFSGVLPEAVVHSIAYHHLLPQGIYPYQIHVGNKRLSGKIIVLRTY